MVVLGLVASLAVPSGSFAYDDLPDTPAITAAKARVGSLQYQSAQIARDLAAAIVELHRLDGELLALGLRVAALEAEIRELERELPDLYVIIGNYRRLLSDRAVQTYMNHANIDAELTFELLASKDLYSAARVSILASSAQNAEIDLIEDVAELYRARLRVRTGMLSDRLDLLALIEVIRTAKADTIRRIATLSDDQARVDAETAAAAARVRRLETVEAERLWRLELERQARDAEERAATGEEPGAAVPEPPPPPPVAEPQGPVAEGDAAALVPIASLICPVPGANFSNDWGNPRSGWRFHAGTDLFAGAGSSNIAVAGGVARQSLSPKGGRGIWLEADHGVSYYYAHLADWVGEWPGGARRVAQGELIGLVGNTGNAAGGPTHTHFQIHPGGGGPVNPYSVVLATCG